MRILSKVYEATDVGCVRPINEDSAAVFAPEVYVVADGMGGHAAGEVASHILVKAVRDDLADCGSIEEQALCRAIHRANREILATVAENPDCQGMGTTATLLHTEQGLAFWAHVGDSRLYLLRDGVLHQVTRDHSYVEDLVEHGELTEAEARIHPQKNMLTRAVGVAEALEVDSGRFDVRTGDILLLATDGLMNMVREEEIASILQQGQQDPARALIEAALRSGGRDNVTAVVVVYGV